MSRKSTVLGVWGLLSVLASSAQAQTAAARPFDEFRSQVPQAQASASLEIRVRWTLDRPVADPLEAAHRFDVLSVQRMNESVPRDRQPMVNSQSLVVVSETTAGQPLDWRIIQDPRVVRSESETAGVLAGQTLYYQQTELLLTIPALDNVSRLHVFRITPQDGIAVMTEFAVVDLP